MDGLTVNCMDGHIIEQNNDKVEEYAICKVRGHTSNYVFMGVWTQCKYCNTYYMHESILREMNAPYEKEK